MAVDTGVDIALVNNMPDAALDATERQFRGLLDAAADGLPVRLTLYTLPEVPRTDFGRKVVSRYASLDDLWSRHHDGVIVTGTEPLAAELDDEPFWGSLTRVLDWAEQHTHSIQIVGSAGHNVACTRTLVVRVGKSFQMQEQIIAQIEFNLA